MTAVQPVIKFENPAWGKQRGYLNANRKYAKYGLTPDTMIGRTVMICGAGPSLADTFEDAIFAFEPDEVWGCNSALRWLATNEKPVTHGVAVAGEDGLLDDWQPFPNVLYYVASGVSPTVTGILHRKHRHMAFFHNLLGIFKTPAAEVEWYGRNYPSAIVVQGGGINVTNRAVALALSMGFDHISVLGADCCCKITGEEMPVASADLTDAQANTLHWTWARQQQMYADGRDVVAAFGQTPMLEGVICGRRILSRPDMLLSAQALVQLKNFYPDRISLIGDTLPNWLLSHPEEEWKAFMPTTDEEGQVVNIGRKQALPIAFPK